MYVPEPGDILLYRRNDSFEVRAIDLVERLSDGLQPYFYYHCSITLDANSVIESNGKTIVEKPFPQSGYDVLRPPIPIEKREAGLQYLRNMVGQRYDWMLIIDDVLRAMSRNLVHLPAAVVQSQERHRKICSSLVVRYLEVTGWKSRLGNNALPEDVYLALRSYEIPTE